MGSIPTPFVGWRGRRFMFKTKTFKTTLEGPRKKVEATLKKLLPAWRDAAVKTGDEAVVTLIDKQLAELED